MDHLVSALEFGEHAQTAQIFRDCYIVYFLRLLDHGKLWDSVKSKFEYSVDLYFSKVVIGKCQSLASPKCIFFQAIPKNLLDSCFLLGQEEDE